MLNLQFKIFSMQAIGPELTFYSASKDVAKSLILSNKLLHAQLDAFCRSYIYIFCSFSSLGLFTVLSVLSVLSIA